MRPLSLLTTGAMAMMVTFGSAAFAQPPAVAAPTAASSSPSQPPSAATPATSPSSPTPATSPSSPTPATPGAPPAIQPPVYGPPPAYGPPGYAPSYPPPAYSAVAPPAVPLDAHSHSGFFLRMALGGGYMANTATFDGTAYQGKVDAIGGAVALEIAIGGALSPGIILAGSYAVHTVGDAKLANDTRTVPYAHDPSLTMLAAMIDVYPNPRGGFHLGGALGFASTQVRADEDAQAGSSSRGGFGIAPHIGYEWWVSNYWGLGVLGRFALAGTKGTYADGHEKDTTTAATILFSATYN